MKNKGFAVTSMVYAIIMLLSITMFIVLEIVRSEYNNQREYIEDVNNSLTECLGKGEC